MAVTQHIILVIFQKQEQRRSQDKPVELRSTSIPISQSKDNDFVKAVIETVPKEAANQGIFPQGARKVMPTHF
jgi:hypothetical protein